MVYLQALIDLGTCLLIAGLAAKICGPRAGRIALLLAALCPFTASYVASPLTETLSIFCVALGFLALAEMLEAPAPAYGRPCSSSPGAMPPCCVPMAPCWQWCCGRRSSSTAATHWGSPPPCASRSLPALLSLLPFVAWTVRNWRTFHVFQPLAPRYANDPGEFAAPGFVRWVRTFAADFTTTSEIYWNGNSDRIDPGNLPARAIDNAAQSQETQRLLQDYNATTTLTPELDARFAQLAQERIRAHPFRYYVTLPLLRLADMWLRPRVETLNRPPALVAICPASGGDPAGDLLRAAQPGLSGGGFSGSAPLAAHGGLHGGADRLCAACCWPPWRRPNRATPWSVFRC